MNFFLYRPDIIDYQKLNKTEPEINLSTAFEVAEEQLGIVPLLDVEGLYLNAVETQMSACFLLGG